MTGFYDVTTTIKNQLILDPFVNTVTEGDIFEVDLSKQTIFPLSHIMVNQTTREGHALRFNVTVLCMDIVDKSKEETTDAFRGNDNEQDVLNTQLAVALRMVEVFDRGSNRKSFALDGEAVFEPFTERFENYLAGWSVTFDVLVPNDMTACDAFVPTTSCPNVTYTILDDAGNTLYSGSIESGGSLNQAINDSTAVLKNTVGTTISTTSINAEGSADITAPDGTVENSDASYTNSVLSNGSLVLPDSQINVNGVDEGDVVSVKTIDVNITDGTDPVTPDSVSLVGNTLTVAVPSGSASIGAKILKTGVSSTSYRTGDDANTDRGRLSSFLVLSSNNVFGNTNRFTDTLGGSVYADGVVLDHSTDDGSEILCYYIGDLTTTRTWADSIDWALGITPLSLSGWGLANINELFEIADKRSTSWLNYSPFNITLQVWSSTAYNSSASLYIYGANRQIQGAGILNNYRAIATRYCTYAELGL